MTAKNISQSVRPLSLTILILSFVLSILSFSSITTKAVECSPQPNSAPVQTQPTNPVQINSAVCEPVVTANPGLQLRITNVKSVPDQFTFGLPDISIVNWDCKSPVNNQKVLGISDYDDAYTQNLLSLAKDQGVPFKAPELFPLRNCSYFNVAAGNLPGLCGVTYNPGYSPAFVNPQSLDDLKSVSSDSCVKILDLKLNPKPIGADQIRYEVPVKNIKPDLLKNFADKNKLVLTQQIDTLVFTNTVFVFTDKDNQLVAINPNQNNSFGGWLVYGVNNQLSSGYYATTVLGENANVTFSYDASISKLSWSGTVQAPNECYVVDTSSLESSNLPQDKFTKYALKYSLKVTDPKAICTAKPADVELKGSKDIQLNADQLNNFASLFSLLKS